jgi:hypothetical protein
MQLKEALSKILASLIGILVIGQLMTLFFVVIITLYFTIAKPDSIDDWIWIGHNFVRFIVIIAGITIGLKFYKEKSRWSGIFHPSKDKVLLSLTLSVCLLAVVLFMQSNRPINLLTSVFHLISYSIAFYPFSALCSYAYHNKGIIGKNIKAPLLLLVLLNPLFIFLALSMEMVITYQPCGVAISAFTGLSPAKSVGMQEGEVIVRINDQKINTISDLKDYMDAYEPDKVLAIHTRTNSYFVRPELQEGRYIIGVNLSQIRCPRSLRS